MTQNLNRRNFIRGTSVLGLSALSGGVWTETSRASTQVTGNLQIACIGTANRAGADINGVRGEDIIALCDVDDRYLGRAGGRFPDATTYNDFREMIADKADVLDAVVVATADHGHAPASAVAMRAGLHCYCEKPLAHTVAESRALAQIAAENELVTQMGTQIHAGNNYRRVVELVRSGIIGSVEEVHVWVGKSWAGRDQELVIEEPPTNLHWDLWLGAAPERGFSAGRYHPGQWRRWWDFGNGTLGDMGCHYMDLPFWALELRHPTSVVAEGPEVHPEMTPAGLKVTYQYPARGDWPAASLTWYDGNMTPSEIHGERVPGSGIMFVGSEGMIFSDYGRHRLLPAENFENFERPEQTIPNSIGHYAEWIDACKNGGETTCNFNYSGALSEAVLLGSVAFRSGERFEWNGETLTASTEAAQQLISKEYREGWDLVLS